MNTCDFLNVILSLALFRTAFSVLIHQNHRLGTIVQKGSLCFVEMGLGLKVVEVKVAASGNKVTKRVFKIYDLQKRSI